MTPPLLPEQESVREAIAAEAVNALDWPMIWKEARSRMMKDMCGEFYDTHLARTVADKLADAILARINSTPTASMVVRSAELVAAHNRSVDDGTLANDPRDDLGHPLHDSVCGWCGKVHDTQPPASPHEH